MNKYLKLLFGLAISAAGLWYAFREMNFNELIENLSQTHMIYVFLSMIIMVASVALRAYRWQLILEPLQIFSFRPLFSATMVGYFGNSVLPFRLGEILRAYAISRSNRITTSGAFGTIILERLLDIIGLAGVMIVCAFFSPLMEWSGNVLIILVILILSGLAFIIWLEKSHSRLHEKMIHWKLFESKSGQKIFSILNNLFKGLTSIKETKHAGQLVIHTVLIWFMYYVCIYLVVLGTGINLSFTGIGIVLIATTLVITVPSAPGFVGTYHAAAVYVLVNLFHIGLTESQAFAVLIHAIGFIPMVCIGFLYFVKSSIHFGDLKTEEITQ